MWSSWTSASLGCFMMNDARATTAGSSPSSVASFSSADASARWMKIHCTSLSGSLSSARTKAQFRRASKRTAGTAPAGARTPCGGDQRTAFPSGAKWNMASPGRTGRPSRSTP